MAKKEKQQQTESTNGSGSSTPFIIIGLVLFAAIVGGYWFYSSSQTTTTTVASNTAVANQPATNGQQQQINSQQAAVNRYNSAPPGAQPPHTLGSPTAVVTVEEFADFECPTCASVHGLMKQINSLYSNRIRFVFRNFPLTQIHANASSAAAAAEAAGLQGKYWDMQNLIFVNQNEWRGKPNAPQLFEKYAQSIGLDIEKFKTDIGSIPVRSRINNDVQRAQALGVNSTPTIFINGKPVPFQQMTLQGLSGIIDYELKTAQNQNQTNTQTTEPKPAESKEANK